MAHQDDDLIEGVQQQYKVIQAARARCEADLAEYRADNNIQGVATELQNIANLDNSARNLNNLVRRHAQSQQPQQQERESVITARRAPADGNDALDIINYGKRPNDPTRLTVEEYNKQFYELGRLKAKGMYRD